MFEGFVLEAKLIEAVEKDRWIVSFQGRLLQVQNTTDTEFEAGKILRLKVKKETPLLLTVIGNKNTTPGSVSFRA